MQLTQPYSELKAYGQFILYTLRNGAYQSEWYRFHERFDDQRRVLLVTNKYALPRLFPFSPASHKAQRFGLPPAALFCRCLCVPDPVTSRYNQNFGLFTPFLGL